MFDPHGTTPLPTSSAGSPVRVWYDGGIGLDDDGDDDNGVTTSVQQQQQHQQPQTTVLANFESMVRYDDCLNGTLIDVNQHFCVYSTVKNGLIRILHRHGPLRSLLRGHTGQRITDIRFFQDGDVLGTVGHSSSGSSSSSSGSSINNRNSSNTNTDNQLTTPSSSLIIWRIYERSPEIMSEKLLEITTPHFIIYRIVWHPFNTNVRTILFFSENKVDFVPLSHHWTKRCIHLTFISSSFIKLASLQHTTPHHTTPPQKPSPPERTHERTPFSSSLSPNQLFGYSNSLLSIPMPRIGLWPV
jgi:hypothetical protein